MQTRTHTAAAAQVMSGLLDWTPSHTSDAFWIQNISKFEQCDFQVSREAGHWGIGRRDTGALGHWGKMTPRRACPKWQARHAVARACPTPPVPPHAAAGDAPAPVQVLHALLKLLEASREVREEPSRMRPVP